MRKMTPLGLPQGTHERVGAAVAGAAVAVSPLLGPHGLELLIWVLVAMGVDLAAGLVKALIHQNLDWKVFMVGVLKKLLVLMAVFPAAMADRLVNLSGVISHESGPVVFAVLVAICMYEGASITRNIKDVYGEAAFVVALIRAWDTLRYSAQYGDRKRPHNRFYDTDKDDRGDDL